MKQMKGEGRVELEMQKKMQGKQAMEDKSTLYQPIRSYVDPRIKDLRLVETATRRPPC